MYSSTSSISMTHKALHTPLLGDELVLLDEEASQQSQQPVNKPTTKSVDDQDDDNAVGTSSWNPSWCMSIVFSLLIFIQFWLALEVEAATAAYDDRRRRHTASILSWPNISMTIVIFAVSIRLYQRACQDSNIKSWILLLLPEIITILVLGLVMFETVILAFLALNVGILILSSLVLVETVHSLFCSKDDHHQHDDDDNETKQFDILIV